MRNRSLLLLISSFFISLITFAQDSNITETGMRSNGKIYVVMTVCITILTGLILYLISIDRKIGKIEQQD
ncbi:MAG: CcmD family protein [Ferruginibacter sp.]